MIRFANVSFAYPQQSKLLEEASFQLESGWTGIVGANGCGKSTLLKLACGRLSATSGVIHREFVSLASSAQGSALTPDVEALATSWTRAALRWLSLLELEPEQFWCWDELSPGTRRRWQVAAALFTEPDVVLLDEPSNHLDSGGRDVLERALGAYRGLGIVVSHDRDLLDGVCTSTLRIERGRARVYATPYSAARDIWLAEEAEQLRGLEHMQARRESLSGVVGAARTRHAHTRHGLRTGSRMTSIRDSDARSTGRKARAAKAEQRLGRASGVAERALARADRALAELSYRPVMSTTSIRVEAAPLRKSSLASIVVEALDAGPRTLLRDTRIAIGRDSRIRLVGPNGCGKTTLLRRIHGSLAASIAERTVYVPQAALEVRRTVEQQIVELDADSLQRVLDRAAALALDPRMLAAIRARREMSLSPGQWRKAALALALARTPWLILLDEPTNDLDIPSLERLETALSMYEGAIVLVTHDERFARSLGVEQLETVWE